MIQPNNAVRCGSTFAGGKMLDWIFDLPNIVILACTVILFGSAAFASPFLGRLLGLKEDKKRDEASFDAFKAVMAMAGVVLAFSLVQAESNLRADQAMVGREASAMMITDRVLQRMGAEETRQARPLLKAFIESQVKQDWPSLVASAGRSAATDRAYTALSKAVRSFEPQNKRQEIMYAELIKAMDDMSDAREVLVQDSTLRLPPFFWVMALSFVGLGLALGVLCEASITRASALGGTAAGIGLLLSFVVIVDEPFHGETSIKPKAIENVLILNGRRIN